MTPLGHLSVSYISARSISRISVPAVIIGGFLPDLDFLFVFFDWFNAYHHVTTHNVFYIGLAALTGYFLAEKKMRTTIAGSLLMGGFLHLLVDSCMDNNPTNGVGVTLLWPLYEGHFSPFNILSDSGVKAGWGEPLKMVKPMMIVVLYELPLYIATAILFLKSKRISIN
ncbi:MAG: metal-dependent hydrolase [Nitrospiraceae bacterium]|nr:MAG: metal-dependent hydrolase [Nitrospiraceae bacterium]